jgi:hypothetical protein
LLPAVEVFPKRRPKKSKKHMKNAPDPDPKEGMTPYPLPKPKKEKKKSQNKRQSLARFA